VEALSYGTETELNFFLSTDQSLETTPQLTMTVCQTWSKTPGLKQILPRDGVIMLTLLLPLPQIAQEEALTRLFLEAHQALSKELLLGELQKTQELVGKERGLHTPLQFQLLIQPTKLSTGYLLTRQEAPISIRVTLSFTFTM
jgi:hypothetical protein